MKDQNTKDEIILKAGSLFARKGFMGTSIRQISTECDVNVSAINYYFSSKENLFIEVVKHNYSVLEEEVVNLDKLYQSTRSYFLEIFRMILRHNEMFLNTFKLFLDDNLKSKEEILVSNKGQFGPPGLDISLEKMRREFKNLNDDDMLN